MPWGRPRPLAYDATKTWVTRVTNPKGQATTTRYYGVNGMATDHGLYGQVKSVTDANGAVGRTRYDAVGRRVKVTQPDGFWTTTSYVSFGTVGKQHVRTASQLGLSTWSYFDGVGRAIKQQSTGPEGQLLTTDTEYDARGAVTRTNLPYAAKEIDTLAAAGNTHPEGLWSDGTTLWVSDAEDEKLYAYDLATKARKPAEDFDTLVAAGNTSPDGLWSDGTTLWVPDGSDAKLYAYDLATKARTPAEDFDTLVAAGNTRPYGLWSDGTTLWVTDATDDKLYAYDLATKARTPAEDFDTLAAAGNTRPEALWSDGTTLWVADTSDEKLYAYDLATKARTPGRRY